MTGPAATTRLVFRLPKSAYIAVMILLFCAVPLAFADSGGDQSGPVGVTWRVLVLALPVIAAVFIARTATFVSAAEIRVRAAFGSRTMAWDSIRGLSVTGRSVYAVCADGSVRLPCVRVSDLAAVSRASEGRLPEIAEPKRKYAPSRRSRR
ncbi:MAG TPA: PH domain-containing protein [Jatrophihabitantaceae bacterium]